jgi:signal transduction histidine kinase
VLADASQLERALLNLVLNARDAMQWRGRITVTTRNTTLGPKRAMLAGITPGPYVRISLRDTGPGMTPEARARAFEPFFTTKPKGAGTGLGLAQVYGFARQSNGYAEIASRKGHGTSVTLYLPPAASPTPD